MTKLKTYAYCTPSHQGMLDTWLRRYLPDDLELIVQYGDQVCQTGDFMKSGWHATMVKKVKLVLQAIKETWGDRFLHVDTDIQFFGPVSDLLDEQLSRYDIVAQDDRSPNFRDAFCGGFFACRSTLAVKRFWQNVLAVLLNNPTRNDQEIFNWLAKRHQSLNNGVRVTSLCRDTFWSPRKAWAPGRPLELPESLRMHHANWTIGVEAKEKQLRLARSIIDRRATFEFHGSDYGGYHIAGQSLDKNSLVYSFGVGEDASFELSLIEKFGVKVHAFDPTPRAIKWSASNFYHMPRIQFHRYGIHNRNGVVRLSTPVDPGHVSCSVFPISDNSFAAPVKKLADIMHHLNHRQIDVLKMDIEGAEHVVIRDMLDSQIYPHQVIVEFHDWITGADPTRISIAALRNAGYDLAHQRGSNFSFIIQ